jgi:Uncharacterised nucleotidyltransferase
VTAPLRSGSPMSGPPDDPELELLLRCARSDTADSAASPRAFLSEKRSIDWGRFVAVADRNGMAPLASHVLDLHCRELVPAASRDLLGNYFRVNELRSRLLTRELRRVLDALESQGIEAVPFKGPLLSTVAYGHPALREFIDLDIIVRHADVPAARERLGKLGYRRDMDAWGPRHERAYIETWNEDLWVSPDGLVYLDLHWRLFPPRFPFQLGPERFRPFLETVSLEGRPVRTLSPEVLLVYLCLHGMKDRWRRLIGLCDVDRVLRLRGAPDWGAVPSLAATAHGRRAVGLGLLLARALLGAPVPDLPDGAALEPDLARRASRIRKVLAEGEPSPTFLHKWLNIRGDHLESLDGFGDRRRYVLRTLLTPNESDWARFRLPDALYPLYYLLRPLRLAARGGKLVWKRGRRGHERGIRSTPRRPAGSWREDPPSPG